jgi:DNA-binding transcriptional LysR family regulator
VNPIVRPPPIRPMKRGADASPAQDITALRSALLVREHLGFRRASEVLGVNQSVLSRRVLALEDALGVSLFQRHAGGARPTGAGERFLREVAQALMLLQQAAAPPTWPPRFWNATWTWR